MIENVREQLLKCGDVKYQDFHSALLPGITNVLGVRLPELRKIAKEIIKSDWQAFLNAKCDDYFEFRLLEAMIIGYLKPDFKEHMYLVKNFVGRINSWGVCDTFCQGLKFVNKHKAEVYEFIQPYFASEDEFEARFAAVMALSYFVDAEYIDRVLEELFNMKNDAYYSKMAVAWAISICFVKFPDKTKLALTTKKLDKFTFSKSISKITDSFRVSAEDKTLVRELRKTAAAG